MPAERGGDTILPAPCADTLDRDRLDAVATKGRPVTQPWVGAGPGPRGWA